MKKAVEFIKKVRVRHFASYTWLHQNSAPNEVYDQFILVLKQHEMKEISMENMNERINILLKPYPSLSQ